jgi:hypothetical protein
MALDDWDKNPDGTIKVFPLVGYDTFRPYGLLCGLRVQYASSDADIDAGKAQAVPLIMTIPQARELAQALTRAADTAHQPPNDETPQ